MIPPFCAVFAAIVTWSTITASCLVLNVYCRHYLDHPHPNLTKDDRSTCSAQDLDSVPPWYEYIAVTNAGLIHGSVDLDASILVVCGEFRILGFVRCFLTFLLAFLAIFMPFPTFFVSVHTFDLFA